MAVPLFNIGGLASGLDTASIIDSLVAVERIPIQQLESRKSLFSSRDAAWQDLTTKFSAIRAALDALKTQDDLNELVTAASSNESVATATPTGSATPSTITFTVDQLATNHQLASQDTFTGPDDKSGAGNFRITQDGTTYTFQTTGQTTIAELAQMINADPDLGVSASLISVDGTDYKLLLTADDTGEASTFTTSGLNLDFDEIQTGQDAQITIGSGGNNGNGNGGGGGLVITRSSNTVTDLIAGVSIDLHQVSTDPVTVTVARDTAVTAEKVGELITAINAAITALQDYTRYDTSTETAGVLAADSNARQVLFDLRSALSGIANPDATEFATGMSIGIELTRDGTVSFDAAKLQEALDANYDEVAHLLTAAGVDGTGIMGSLDSYVDSLEGADGKIARARNLWEAQIAIIDDRIEVLEDRIDRREARLIRQFAGLETAMATLSSQAQWLASQLGAQQQ